MSELSRFWLRSAVAVFSALSLFFVWLFFGIAIGAISGSIGDIVMGWTCLIGGPFVSAGSILLLARWINRRNDPRHRKRPPDAPRTEDSN
jgi:hypothetical protein